MEFASVLNEYLLRLGCKAKTLADAAGVSAIQISRWRKGTRRPSPDALPTLAEAISGLSGGAMDVPEVLAALQDAAPARRRPRNGLGKRLDILLDTLKVHTSEIARVVNFDPSYLSRIRTGKRNPGNTEPIVDGVSRYIARRCTAAAERAAAAELMGVERDKLDDPEGYRETVAAWLRGGVARTAIPGADVSALLAALDSFDLNEYIRAIRIDDAPAAPDGMPEAYTGTGLRDLMRCHLDFLRAAERSDSAGRVLIYTEMPIMDMAKDPDFPKQWMRASAELLKKGVEIDMIHNVNRPFEELLLGLEIHIPMYMTGRITPYYLRESGVGPFRHVLGVSGGAVLWGEAVAGRQADCRCALVTDPAELGYYRRMADALRERAAPLMEIYTAERAGELREFLRQEAAAGCRPVPIEMPAFRNVSVRVCHERWAIVSKDSDPRVDFVICHPRLVDAIERFAAPLVDE